MRKIKINFILPSLLGMIFCLSCSKNESRTDVKQTMDTTKAVTTTTSHEILSSDFAVMPLPDHRIVIRYTLTNKNGIQMQVMNYGGIITSLKVPDKNGKIEDIVLGYDSFSDYVKESPYFGALIGRYGNRIAKGKFKIDNQTYNLAQNNNGQHLHGGLKGFDKVYWNIEEIENEEGPALKLTYNSKDMEEGYPGNLVVEVIYVLTNNNELKLFYKATTDKKTIVNLTQHSYFNLSGNCKRDILGHELTLNADQFVPIDKTLIPFGELKNVKETPFDFTERKKIGRDINAKDDQLTFGLGYDHCWVLNTKGDSSKVAATLRDPESGRSIEIYTTEPGLQFYSGNFLDGTLIGKDSVKYNYRYGLCLESEHFPDSPNKPQYPSTILKPGEIYKTSTVYKFGVK
jgi:aldose 1-epimerase